MLRSTPLDDFLNDAPASDAAVRLETIGLAISLPTVMVSIGVIAYLAWVHRGERREVTGLVRIAIVAAVASAFGAAIEVLGTSRLFEISWADAFADGTAAAPMMRMMAALMIALGLYDHAVPLDGPDDPNDPDDNEHSESLPGQLVRWVPSAASAFALVGAALAVLSFSFDGHTVDTPPRLLMAALDATHVTAGAVWLGGVVGIVIVSQFFRRGSGSIASLLIRFSGVAALSLLAVVIAGVLMSWAIVDGVRDYTETEWGRRLIAKVVVVSVAAACGAYNHFRVIPKLAAHELGSHSQREVADPADSLAPAESVARRVLLVEALALVGALALTAILVQASTI
jgi:copper transport protein